jgi:hypothetical protein
MGSRGCIVGMRDCLPTIRRILMRDGNSKEFILCLLDQKYRIVYADEVGNPRAKSKRQERDFCTNVNRSL